MPEPIHDESCLSGCIGGTDHDAQRTYVAHAEGCPNAPLTPYELGEIDGDPAVPPSYPCEKCGKPRTRAEGGTTFTVCDECWGETNVRNKLLDPMELLAQIEALKAERDEWRVKAKAQVGYVALMADAARGGITRSRTQFVTAHDELARLRAEVARLTFDVGSLSEQNRILGEVYGEARAEVARMGGLILLSRCGEEYRGVEACERHCGDLVPLHAEARAIKARQA